MLAVLLVNAHQEENMAHNLPKTRGCQPEGEVLIVSIFPE
jgi:hypothetical protein